jgi:hypothetical protein
MSETSGTNSEVSTDDESVMNSEVSTDEDHGSSDDGMSTDESVMDCEEVETECQLCSKM